MSGRIARRIGFRFHDAATEAAGRKIVNDDFSDEEAREPDGVRRKLGASKTMNCEFFRCVVGRNTRRPHGVSAQRGNSFCTSSEESRS